MLAEATLLLRLIVPSPLPTCLLCSFVFLPYHRASLAKAGMPRQNGETHAAAGDIRSQEASFVLKTNDPAGFTIGDVRWGGGLGVWGGTRGCPARPGGGAVAGKAQGFPAAD